MRSLGQRGTECVASLFQGARGTEGFRILVQLLLFAILYNPPFSTHSQVRIISQSCWSQNSPITNNTAPSFCLFSIPALRLVLIKICKFPDEEKMPGCCELVYFSSVRSDSRETGRDVRCLLRLCVHPETDRPSTHSSSPGLYLPQPHLLCLSVPFLL